MKDDGSQPQSDKPIFIFHTVKSTDIPYFSVSRSFAQDTALSYEAAGLLLYLQSKPDTWRVQPSTLQRVKCGKNRVYVLLKELITRGYVRREIFRAARGRVDHVAYYVYPMSQLPTNHNPVNQEHENHNPENSDIRNKRVSKNKREEHTTPATQSVVSVEKQERPRNAMYDTIQHIWNYQGAMNGRFAQFLTGCAKKVNHEANVIPATNPEELASWFAWYKAKHKNNGAFIMVTTPAKIQESIYEYRRFAALKMSGRGGENESDAERSMRAQHESFLAAMKGKE